MIVLLILLLTLDFQRLELPDDAMEKSFVVSPLQNESLTGCATNPQSGGNNPLTIDRIAPPEFATEIISASELPVSESGTHTGGHFGRDSGNFQPMATVPPVDAPTPPPPIIVTPEPATVAILGITAALLLFLLFGRQCGQKLSR